MKKADSFSIIRVERLSYENPVSTKGCFAEVFFPSDGRAYKLFRSRIGDPSGSLSDAQRSRAFESELAAYRIAMGSPAVRALVPEFFGVGKVDHVIRDGKDISSGFLLDHCLVMERIMGRDEKVANVDGTPLILTAIERFKEVGIRGIKEDASVFFPSEPERIKFIDIATHRFGD